MHATAFPAEVASQSGSDAAKLVLEPSGGPQVPAPAARINLIAGNAYSLTGGIQTINRLLVRELAAAGWLRRAFLLWDGNDTVNEEGCEVRRRGLASFYGRNRARLSAALAAQALRFPGDLWLCTHVNYAPLALGTCLGRTDRMAVLLHADELDNGLTARAAWALKRAGLVIAVSDYTRQKAIRLGVRPERMHVLLNAVERAPVGPPPDRTGRAPQVLFVGRLDERYKGQMDLLDAMVRLRDRWPALRLVFVGEGRSLPRWQAEAANRGLTNVVEFRGRVSDGELARAYAEATLFAMPSENEGFGLVYAEAMAHGLPCIASTRDAAGEVVLDGETGLLVPVRDPAALAEAIHRLVASPELRQRMGAAGRLRFEQHFTPEKYRERLLALMAAWHRTTSTRP